MTGVHVDLLLGGSEQIQQERSKISVTQLLGDVAIARRVSAASAAVREHDEALRTVRNRQIAVERDASGINQDISFIDIERVRLHVTALRGGEG